MGTFVSLIVVGTVFLAFDTTSEKCQIAKIVGVAELPICGKGAFLIVASIVILALNKIPARKTAPKIPEGAQVQNAQTQIRTRIRVTKETGKVKVKKKR